MCKYCVDEGTMTQEEMDRRVLSGDMTVMPIMDFPRERVVEMLSEMVAEAVGNGMGLIEAMARAELVLDSYDEVREAGL